MKQPYKPICGGNDDCDDQDFMQHEIQELAQLLMTDGKDDKSIEYFVKYF